MKQQQEAWLVELNKMMSQQARIGWIGIRACLPTYLLS